MLVGFYIARSDDLAMDTTLPYVISAGSFNSTHCHWFVLQSVAVSELNIE